MLTLQLVVISSFFIDIPRLNIAMFIFKFVMLLVITSLLSENFLQALGEQIIYSGSLPINPESVTVYLTSS